MGPCLSVEARTVRMQRASTASAHRVRTHTPRTRQARAVSSGENDGGGSGAKREEVTEEEKDQDRDGDSGQDKTVDTLKVVRRRKAHVEKKYQWLPTTIDAATGRRVARVGRVGVWERSGAFDEMVRGVVSDFLASLNEGDQCLSPLVDKFKRHWGELYGVSGVGEEEEEEEEEEDEAGENEKRRVGGGEGKYTQHAFSTPFFLSDTLARIDVVVGACLQHGNGHFYYVADVSLFDLRYLSFDDIFFLSRSALCACHSSPNDRALIPQILCTMSRLAALRPHSQTSSVVVATNLFRLRKILRVVLAVRQQPDQGTNRGSSTSASVSQMLSGFRTD